MASPEQQINIPSFLDIFFISFPFPVTNTITHAITSTTVVRMAVPRFDSTPLIPILPRMDVRLANTADPQAYQNQLLPFFSTSSPVSFFWIIRYIPAVITRMAAAFPGRSPSWKKISARIMVSTVLDLSTGTTLLTSPI